MILEGAQRGGWVRLSQHLLNRTDNDHVEVHEVSGFLASDLMGALQEVDAIAKGTRCKQFFFSLSLSPPEAEDVPISAFEDAIARVEAKLSLAGQPRAIVFHEKNGRRHAHCVWSRINVAEMKAINMSCFKAKLTDLARDLYIEHGWDLPEGFKDRERRSPDNHSNIEALQAKRVKKDPKVLKQIFRQCWEASDSRSAFAQALKEHSLVLAKGDQRGFVAVDENGKVYSIARWVGEKSKTVRERLGTLDDLPSIEDAHAVLVGKTDQSLPSPDQQDALLAELEQRRLALAEKQRAERDALDHRHAIRRTEEIRLRASRLPKGMKAAFAKLAGNYQQIIEQNILEALACKERDQKERQALVQQHLKQRRALVSEFQQSHLQAGFHSHWLEADPDQPLLLPADEERRSNKEKINHDPAHIISLIADKQEYFSRSDIMRGLADYIDNPMDLHGALDKALTCKDLIKHIDHGANGQRLNTLYTSADFQACKRDLMRSVHDLSDRVSHFVDPATINKAIQDENAFLHTAYGAHLSEEQENAIRHVLNSNQLSCVVGLAGAGKSTLLKAAKSAWQHQGYRVVGAALSGKAADGLQSSSGIESRTLASLAHSWASGYETLDQNAILVIDEVGMIGTRQLAHFVQEAEKTGVKIILVGDPDQLQPIQVGTPFKEIANTIETVKLTEVRRQKSEWQRQATQLFADGKNKEAISAYRKQDCVIETRCTDDAICKLAEDYLSDLELHGTDASRLALAHRRKDVHAINQTIRQMRKASGDLSHELLFATNHGPRAFAVSDRIVFTRNDRTLGVKNGMLGKVQSIDQNKLSIQLDEEGGTSRTITIEPPSYDAIDHGYAITIHKSQGATVDRAYVLGSKTMDHHLTYVAMSRHREEARLYADKAALRRMEHDRDEWEQGRGHVFNHGPSPTRH